MMIDDFIRQDYHSHPLRLTAEVLGMAISLGVAVIIMMTTPVPPMLICYILWEVASLLLVSASYSRGSLGLTTLYAGFLCIDAIGLIRTVLA
jgi:hypothetical protein